MKKEKIKKSCSTPGCGGDYHADGKCQKCYHREYSKKKWQKTKEGLKRVRVQPEIVIQPSAEDSPGLQPDARKVELDFAEYGELFKDLRKVAAEELRSIHNQALWYIKQGLHHDGE